MISCSDAKKLVNNYIDGLLSEADCSCFEEHISCCEQCHNEYDMLKTIVGDLSNTKATLPADFAKKMHIALVNNQLKSEKKKNEGFFGLPYMKLTTVATAAIMIAVIGKFGVYDAYKNISTDTMQTESVETVEKNNETATPETTSGAENTTRAVADSEKAQENIKIVKAVKKADDTKAVDSVYTKNTALIDTEDTHTFTARESTPALPPQQAETVVEDSSHPLAVARMMPGEQIVDIEDIEDTANVVTSTSPVMESEMDSTPGNEKTVTNEDAVVEEEADEDVTASSGGANTVDNAESTLTEEGAEAIEESAPAESKFILTESDIPAPTIVEIYKSGEGNMPIIKNYLYTFLDGSEIAETDGQITVTISTDEFESVMKKISVNEYVKEITVGNARDGIAVIIIK